LIIEKFVPRSEIDERYLDSPYYLTPENKVGQDAFGVIREAMKRKNMVGLGKVVISRRERIVKLKDYAFLRLTCPCGRITDYPSGLLLQRRGVSRESFLGNIEKIHAAGIHCRRPGKGARITKTGSHRISKPPSCSSVRSSP
jgi:hypothetical protein